MHFLTATVKMGVPVHTRYRCSKCGSDNDCVCTVWVSREKTVNITENKAYQELTYEQSMKKAQEEAFGEAEIAMRVRLEHLLPKGEPRYDTGVLDCKCAKCGHREPWAKSAYKENRNSFFKTLCIATAVVGVSAVLAVIRYGITGLGLVLLPMGALGILWAIFLVWKGAQLLLSEQNSGEDEGLPVDALPTLSYDMEEKQVEYSGRHFQQE